MSLAMSLPFKAGDRVMAIPSTYLKGFATVLACEARAEWPDGIYFVIRRDDGQCMAALPSLYQPIPSRRELIRLVPGGASLPVCAAGKPPVSECPPRAPGVPIQERCDHE